MMPKLTAGSVTDPRYSNSTSHSVPNREVGGLSTVTASINGSEWSLKFRWGEQGAC